MMRVIRAASLALGVLACPAIASAATCPVQQLTPEFTAGGNVFGRIAAQWNAYFGSKVDANNGTLCDPTIIIHGSPAPEAANKDLSNLNQPTATRNVLPTPTLNDCMIGTGTDWAPGPCIGMVGNNVALRNLVTTTFASVYRAGFAAPGDGGAATYVLAAGGCTLGAGAGDNGYEVSIITDATHCWKLSPVFPIDPGVWGIAAGAAATYYVRAAGNDYGSSGSGKNSCLVVADPCLTWGQASAQVMRIAGHNISPIINVGAGHFNGGQMSGRSPLSSTGNSGRGQVRVLGAGAGVTFFDAGTSPYAKLVFVLQGGALASFGGLTINVPATNGYGVFAQDTASYVTFEPGTEIIGSDATSIGTHSESSATIEVPGNAGLSIKGTFFDVHSAQNHSNLLVDGSTTTCEGTVATFNFVEVVGGSDAHFGQSTAYSGCSGLTGKPVQAYNGGFVRNDGAQLPGNGYFDSNQTDFYWPPFRPALAGGGCTNGTISAASTNYTIYVQIAGGSNSACIINFGEPAAPAAGWFALSPVCQATLANAAGIAIPLSIEYGTKSITVFPPAGSPAIDGNAYLLSCRSLF